MTALSKIALYLSYTKPRVWILLVFVSGVGAVMAAANRVLPNLPIIVLAVVATLLGSAGAESVTNYLDRDIDLKMQRTRNRPIPSGRISSRNGVLLGYTLISISIIILLLFSRIISAAFMALGIFDNVFIYSYLLKRRSIWSIVLGGFSGGFPVVIGWYSVTARFSILPWFLFALVVVWIPIHVWSIAYRYEEDYRNARVPMLPAVYPVKISATCISASALILIVVSFMPVLFGNQSPYLLLALTVLSIPLAGLSIRFMWHPSKEYSYQLFKYSNPYLAILFIVFMVYGMV